MVKNMTKTIKARLRVVTPHGHICSKVDEIPNTKIAFQDYVMEVTSLIVDAGPDGIANFTEDGGNVVFIMPETLKNSIVYVEKVVE